MDEALRDQRLLRDAEPHLQRLRAASERMVGLRNRFEPLYHCYFPQSWFVTITRILRLTPQPDFSRHRAELQLLRDQAWETIESSKAAFEAFATTGADRDLKRVAELSYLQDHYDGTVIVLMNEYVSGMEARQASSFVFAKQMLEHAQKAQDNLRELTKATAALR